MPLATFDSKEIRDIEVKPLTIDSFAKFGLIVSPNEEIQRRNASAQANYGTAIKLRQVSVFTNNFHKSQNNPESKTNINVFRCFPPKHLMETTSNHSFRYTCKVLERHPFSSQTFTPMGRDRRKIGYIVICASNDGNSEQNLPDLSTIEAFYCMADQAVTYGAGTWHAPMIAVSETFGSGSQCDDDFLDFQVLISENDVPEDDCEECYFDPGFTVSLDVKI